MGGGPQLETVSERVQIEVVASIVARVWPGEHTDVDGIWRWLHREAAPLLLLAHLDGEAVGTGWCAVRPDPDVVPLMVRVVTEARGRGVGTALLGALSAHGRAHGRREARGRLREGDAQEVLPWLERRGFRAVDRRFESTLDLAVAPPPAAPPVGIALVSLAERPDLVRAAYDVEVEAVPDIPTASPPDVLPFDAWRAATVDDPDFLAGGSFVALAGGEAVGYAALERQGDGEAVHQITAVRRAWRGRGVAGALKRAQIKWARGAGLARLLTDNDEANAAMRGINARLGYVPGIVEIVVRGPLAADGG